MSLRDQLVAVGLITEKQLQQAKRQQHQHQPPRRREPDRKAPNVDGPKLPGPKLLGPKPGGPKPGGPKPGGPKSGGPKVDEGALAAQRAADEKRARDLEANRRVQEQLAHKARRAEIRQLIEQHRLPRIESDESYNFIDGKKIRRIPADAARREQFVRGALAIVRFEGRYEVVPAAIGERIREREASIVMQQNGAPAAVDETDPYKDFVVPDDLHW